MTTKPVSASVAKTAASTGSRSAWCGWLAPSSAESIPVSDAAVTHGASRIAGWRANVVGNCQVTADELLFGQALADERIELLPLRAVEALRILAAEDDVVDLPGGEEATVAGHVVEAL